MIQYVNNVKLAGVVYSLKTTQIQNSFSYRFVLVVNNVYTDKDKQAYVDVQHIPVSYFSSSSEEFSDKDNVEVEGRISTKTYITSDNNTRKYFEVHANRIKKL